MVPMRFISLLASRLSMSTATKAEEDLIEAKTDVVYNHSENISPSDMDSILSLEDPIFRSLFHVTRLERPFTWRTLLFFMYLPIGCIVFLWRMLWLAIWDLVIFDTVDRFGLNSDLFIRIYITGFLMFTDVKGW
eukprot:GEZU01011622.1.p1 GENE.GEZU01011622.1~~GEZU01011622.1.p1  ORF type:complete len:134 (-),score=20.87 GEZU01011622.1:103-504(-)